MDKVVIENARDLAENKAELTKAYGSSEKDTGKAEVQIAIMSKRIAYLTKHFATHKKDHHSRRGLFILIGKRRKLLKYLEANTPSRYKDVIKALGLRR